MSEELKPCPFCGSTETRTNYALLPEVICLGCDATIDTGYEMDDAIKLWNTRPIEDALQARIAELEWNNSELTDENAELTLRVTEMETELNLLKQERDFWNEVYREREDANDVN